MSPIWKSWFEEEWNEMQGNNIKRDNFNKREKGKEKYIDQNFEDVDFERALEAQSGSVLAFEKACSYLFHTHVKSTSDSVTHVDDNNKTKNNAKYFYRDQGIAVHSDTSPNRIQRDKALLNNDLRNSGVILSSPGRWKVVKYPKNIGSFSLNELWSNITLTTPWDSINAIKCYLRESIRPLTWKSRVSTVLHEIASDTATQHAQNKQNNNKQFLPTEVRKLLAMIFSNFPPHFDGYLPKEAQFEKDRRRLQSIAKLWMKDFN